MSMIQRIAERPTVLVAFTEHRKADGTAWYSRDKFHESLTRASAILEYVQALLEQGAPSESVLMVLKDLRSLPSLEMEAEKA